MTTDVQRMGPAKSEDEPANARPVFHRPSASGGTWARVWRRFLRHKPGVAGSVVMILLILMAIFAPIVALGKDPYETNYARQYIDSPPSREYIMGTDQLGRDIWARTVYGGRVSISVAIVVTLVTTTIGALVGGVSGYFGGAVDTAIQRFTEAVGLFPTFQLILIVTTFLKPSIWNVMLILTIFGWAGTSQTVRTMFLYTREADYVLAARAIGVRWPAIVVRHVLPACMAPLIVGVSIGLVGVIMTESSLSFLGLGVQEPTPSWGSMLQGAMKLPILVPYPWRWLPPAILICVATLAANFMGDGLRDALDPTAIER